MSSADILPCMLRALKNDYTTKGGYNDQKPVTVFPNGTILNA